MPDKQPLYSGTGQKVSSVPTNTIGESTPITVALAILLLGVAFSTGVLYNKVTTLDTTQKRQEQLLETVVTLSRDNKYRIDQAEADRKRLEREHADLLHNR